MPVSKSSQNTPPRSASVASNGSQNSATPSSRSRNGTAAGVGSRESGVSNSFRWSLYAQANNIAPGELEEWVAAAQASIALLPCDTNSECSSHASLAADQAAHNTRAKAPPRLPPRLPSAPRPKRDAARLEILRDAGALVPPRPPSAPVPQRDATRLEMLRANFALIPERPPTAYVGGLPFQRSAEQKQAAWLLNAVCKAPEKYCSRQIEALKDLYRSNPAPVWRASVEFLATAAPGNEKSPGLVFAAMVCAQYSPHVLYSIPKNATTQEESPLFQVQTTYNKAVELLTELKDEYAPSGGDSLAKVEMADWLQAGRNLSIEEINAQAKTLPQDGVKHVGAFSMSKKGSATEPGLVNLLREVAQNRNSRVPLIAAIGGDAKDGREGHFVTVISYGKQIVVLDSLSRGTLGREVLDKIKKISRADLQEGSRPTWLDRWSRPFSRATLVVKRLQTDEIMRNGGGLFSFELYRGFSQIPGQAWRAGNNLIEKGSLHKSVENFAEGFQSLTVVEKRHVSYGVRLQLLYSYITQVRSRHAEMMKDAAAAEGPPSERGSNASEEAIIDEYKPIAAHPEKEPLVGTQAPTLTDLDEEADDLQGGSVDHKQGFLSPDPTSSDLPEYCPDELQDALPQLPEDWEKPADVHDEWPDDFGHRDLVGHALHEPSANLTDLPGRDHTAAAPAEDPGARDETNQSTDRKSFVYDKAADQDWMVGNEVRWALHTHP